MLSERIRMLRKERGYSQEQMARKLNITQGAVSQWENGLTVPAADQLSSLADIFGITVDELLGRDPEKPEIPEDDDVWALRDMLRRDTSMHILFNAAKTASPEHIRAAAAMLQALKKEEE